MGHYIIEGQVLFSPEKQLITHIASNESTDLSFIATQILVMLLEQHGHVVEREAIFSGIFDRHGAASTNNNLNQYILNLRKQLHFFGVETEVIQTIPRIGFIVPSGVEITFAEPVVKPETLTKPSVSLLSSQSRRGALLANLWIVAMVIITLYNGFRIWKEAEAAIIWGDTPLVKVTPLNDDKMCQIFLIRSGIGYKKGDVDPEAVLKHFNKLTCDAGINTRYYLFHSVPQKSKFRNFVLKCTGDEVHSPSCFSHYLNVELF
ncbi:winged helix-turn-helix domain-containing protein [Klebsiella pneumoniae]|uniref:winged helix-turn-helix domain-containing protein n=1 Tax=Klebsiella pneumoniae TaxID=573 RepID=UPI0039B68256